ncbi:MAG: hypothetical protein HXY26_10870 [Hydrogenophilaceae bacterium]|nr:hypothetical protein [Hydrogenophilaceae bacterium]
MNSEQPLSDEYLNAFVDGELSPLERAQAIERISGDALLKKQVCELNMLKEMVKSSYRSPDSAMRDLRAGRRRTSLRYGLAACCLVVLGVSAGWLSRGLIAVEDPDLRVANLKDVIADSDRVVLHLDTASPVRFERALDRTERLLVEAQSEGRTIQLHLAANSHGVDLFRTSTSPFAGRIHDLQARYPNLTFIACGQTIRRLQVSKQDTRLLPEVRVVPAVFDEVVNSLKTGWTYIKV